MDPEFKEAFTMNLVHGMMRRLKISITFEDRKEHDDYFRLLGNMQREMGWTNEELIERMTDILQVEGFGEDKGRAIAELLAANAAPAST